MHACYNSLYLSNFILVYESLSRIPLPLTHEQSWKEMCAACGGKAGKNKVTEALGEKSGSGLNIAGDQM